VQTDFNAVRGELTKDIQEKKLRLLMTKEFDRLREVAQVDNFLAGTSQSGRSTAAASAGGPQSPRVGAMPQPGAAMNKAGALPPRGMPAGSSPGSASLPRPSGPQSR
jgi:hypothetical protein